MPSSQNPFDSIVDVEAFTTSLEMVVERSGDPAAQVYSRLFLQYPELEPMFAIDSGGAARNEMVRLCFDALLDLCGDGKHANGLLKTELQNHGMWGVSPRQFQSLFRTVRDVVKEINGADWNTAAENAWNCVLSRVDSPVNNFSSA